MNGKTAVLREIFSGNVLQDRNPSEVPCGLVPRRLTYFDLYVRQKGEDWSRFSESSATWATEASHFCEPGAGCGPAGRGLASFHDRRSVEGFSNSGRGLAPGRLAPSPNPRSSRRFKEAARRSARRAAPWRWEALGAYALGDAEGLARRLALFTPPRRLGS